VVPVADPDVDLRGEGGVVLLALPAYLPSVMSSFFTENKVGRGPRPPSSSPRSATEFNFAY